MAIPKYRAYFRQMISENEALFAEFAQVHALYQQDRKKHQHEFNEKGAVISDILRDWERRLCGYSERGENAVFSSKLADKFRDEARAFFPLIDFIGVKYD